MLEVPSWQLLYRGKALEMAVVVWVHTGLRLGNGQGNWSGSGSMIQGGMQFGNRIRIVTLQIGMAQRWMPNLFLMGPAQLFAKP